MQSLLLATSLGAVAQAWSLGAVGMLAAFSLLAILEWQEYRRPQNLALVLPLTGFLAGLSLSLVEPWPALLAGAVASAWIHARRVWSLPSSKGLPARETSLALIVGAAVIPLALASGLWRVVPQGRALLIMAGLLTVVTLAIRR